MSIMKRTSKEDAVSPVVGVMLMLVVTIVIAAVVAAFAGGLGTTTEPADIALLKLTDYKLGTVDQSKTTADDLYASYKAGWYDYGLGAYGPNSNYGIYSMKFKNMGGDKLFTDDLKLQITYNAATSALPFKGFVNAKEWAVGDTVTLEITKEMLKDVVYSGGYIDRSTSAWAYGLGQQSMAQESPSSFTWQILDANNNILAKGTESTKWTQNVISVTVDAAYTHNVAGTITVSAPGYDDNTEVTIAVADGAGFSLTPLTGTIEDGAATISVTPTLDGSEQKIGTITVTVGSVKVTKSITVNPAGSP